MFRRATFKEKVIKLCLIRVGIKCDYYGFTYLVHAVDLAIDNPHLIYHARELYEQVAKRCKNATATKVETNIQNAINYTYNNRGFYSINLLFRNDLIRPDHKPTVPEFVKLMAEYYNLKMYENEPPYVDRTNEA